jgi:hypothetical protein
MRLIIAGARNFNPWHEDAQRAFDLGLKAWVEAFPSLRLTEVVVGFGYLERIAADSARAYGHPVKEFGWADSAKIAAASLPPAPTMREKGVIYRRWLVEYAAAEPDGGLLTFTQPRKTMGIPSLERLAREAGLHVLRVEVPTGASEGPEATS